MDHKQMDCQQTTKHPSGMIRTGVSKKSRRDYLKRASVLAAGSVNHLISRPLSESGR